MSVKREFIKQNVIMAVNYTAIRTWKTEKKNSGSY